MKWIIEIESFTVEADTEEAARKRAEESLTIPRTYPFPDIKNITTEEEVRVRVHVWKKYLKFLGYKEDPDAEKVNTEE